MLLVPEGGRVGGMDLSRGLLEAGDGTALVSTFGEGVAARASDPTQPSRFLAGVGQCHEGDATESEVAPLALDDGPQHPTLRAARGHEQIQATTVGEPSGAVSRPRGQYRPRGECFLWVPAALLFPHRFPHC